MRSVWLLLGFIIILTGWSWWYSKGANRGWTKTVVHIEKIDEITEIPYVVEEKRFVPGIEFPAGFTSVGGLFLLLGWWQGRKKGKARG
jgi:hypothetical protein